MSEPMSLDSKTRGAWVVHHTNKIEAAGNPAGLNAIRRAGNCGMLLSSLAASNQQTLTTQQVETLATVLTIDPTYQLPSLLDTLKEHQLIDRSASGISVLGLTTSSLLEHADRIYVNSKPTAAENAALELAELCSQEPRAEANVAEYLADQHKLAKPAVRKLMGTVEQLGLCDTESLDQQQKLFFNGNLFRHNETVKARKVLDTLSSTDKTAVSELDGKLKREGCVGKTAAKQILGDPLFSKMNAIGFYDVNTVSNDKESVEYILRPSAFNKFGRADISDSFDLAKALIASLQYGISRSAASRGRIVMLGKLMQKLIDGRTVGPCTAIGQDYRILELRGVVRVIPDVNGMFTMRLLKRDIGELALQVLQSGDASERSLTVLPGSPVAEFTGPEVNRVHARADGKKRSLDVRKALDVLRTGGL
jgi:hypothetical protein